MHRNTANLLAKVKTSGKLSKQYSSSKLLFLGEIEDINMLERLVAEINGTISKQSFKLKFFVCEVTNQKVLVWLNTKNDDISKLQIKFSPVELEYFHAILQELIHNEEHRLTTIVCINITSTLTSHLTRENGQKLLNIFLKNGYFVVKGAYIYLGPRLILEFTIYLKTHCPESVCTLCSELVFCVSNFYYNHFRNEFFEHIEFNKFF